MAHVIQQTDEQTQDYKKHLSDSVSDSSPQLLTVIVLVMAMLDFFYTVDRGRHHPVAHYQYLSPAVLAVTMVSMSTPKGSEEAILAHNISALIMLAKRAKIDDSGFLITC